MGNGAGLSVYEDINGESRYGEGGAKEIYFDIQQKLKACPTFIDPFSCALFYTWNRKSRCRGLLRLYLSGSLCIRR